MSHVRKQTITFVLTTLCNLKCIYCYGNKNINIKPEHKTLNFNFAKKGMDDFFRDYPSNSIRFYGAGEPTLEFDLMKDITEYARKKLCHSLNIELQTNGIFSDEIADWISRNVDVLWISCDGPKAIQNLQRPTKSGGASAELVEKNIKKFSKLDHVQVGVRATLTNFAIKKQLLIVEYFNDLEIKYVNVHPACLPVCNDKNDIFDWDPIEFAENFLQANMEAKKLGMFYNSLYITNFDEKTRHACRSCIPYPMLTTDGYVSCCDFGQFGPEYLPGPLQQLIYGKYIPEKNIIIYDEDKVHKIRSRCVEKLLDGPCAGCEYVYHCAGGCLGQALNETGDLMGIHKRNCAITKYLAARMPLNKGLYPIIHS